MSADPKTEATWRGFFLAAIDAGVGTVAGMITGFIVGVVADTAIFATTGHGLLHYGYLFAQAGTYTGLFLGIVVGIGSGTSAAFESSKGRTASPPDEVSVRVARTPERGSTDGKRGRDANDSDDLGGAAAA